MQAKTHLKQLFGSDPRTIALEALGECQFSILGCSERVSELRRGFPMFLERVEIKVDEARPETYTGVLVLIVTTGDKRAMNHSLMLDINWDPAQKRFTLDLERQTIPRIGRWMQIDPVVTGGRFDISLRLDDMEKKEKSKCFMSGAFETPNPGDTKRFTLSDRPDYTYVPPDDICRAYCGLLTVEELIVRSEAVPAEISAREQLAGLQQKLEAKTGELKAANAAVGTLMRERNALRDKAEAWEKSFNSLAGDLLFKAGKYFFLMRSATLSKRIAWHRQFAEHKPDDSNQ